MCIRKIQTSVRFEGHCRTVVPQYRTGTCYLPGVQNLDVVPRFMESVCTLASFFATFICCTIVLHWLAQYNNYDPYNRRIRIQFQTLELAFLQ